MKRLIADLASEPTDPLALGQDEAEIDRLGHQQRSGHDQRDLADQAFRQQAPHSFRTSAASV